MRGFEHFFERGRDCILEFDTILQDHGIWRVRHHFRKLRGKRNEHAKDLKLFFHSVISINKEMGGIFQSSFHERLTTRGAMLLKNY